MRKPQNILVIAPHCDDAEYGLGGFLAKLKEEVSKHYVTLLVIGPGSYVRKKVVTDPTLAREEQEQSWLNMDLNGELIFLNHPGNYFDQVPIVEIAADIEQVMDRAGADTIFIPLPSYNQDHKVVHDACLIALRPGNLLDIDTTIYAYEYPGNCWGTQAPNTGKVYVSLGVSQINKKLECLKKHKSQTKGKLLFGTDSVKELARVRGNECGYTHAELFYLYRMVVV